MKAELEVSGLGKSSIGSLKDRLGDSNSTVLDTPRAENDQLKMGIYFQENLSKAGVVFHKKIGGEMRPNDPRYQSSNLMLGQTGDSGG